LTVDSPNLKSSRIIDLDSRFKDVGALARRVCLRVGAWRILSSCVRNLPVNGQPSTVNKPYGMSTAAAMTVVQAPSAPIADCVQFIVFTILPEIFHCSSRWSHVAPVS